MADIEYDNTKFVLVCDIKHSTGNTWVRVFGPFDTRYKAMGAKKRMIREFIQDDHYSAQWVEDNVKFRITTIWTRV